MLSLGRPAVDANNNPLDFTWTAAQVDAALHAPASQWLFRYDLLANDNSFIRQLRTVLDTGSPSITYDTTQQVKRTCQLTVQDDGTINYASNRIKPFGLLRMGPQGIYGFNDRVVLYDSRFPVSWVNNPTALASALIAQGFVQLDAYQTQAWMRDRIAKGTAPGSVCVNALGIEPDTIAETEDTNCTVYQYMKAGGRFVHVGDVQFYYQGHVDGSTTNWGTGGSSAILGVGTQDWGDPTTATITAKGSQWGMTQPDDGSRPVPVGDVTLIFSEIASASAACTWLKNFNTQYPTSGFVRYRAEGYDGSNAAWNADVFRMATFTLTQASTQYAQFPLGVFLMSSPTRHVDATGVVTRQIQGYDLLQILVSNYCTSRYTVTAGTNYIAAVRDALKAAGITTGLNLTPTSDTLPVTRDWKLGTPYLTIINDLLSAINYNSLWFDANGVCVAEPYVTPNNRASTYTFAADQESILSPVVQETLDLFSVPNTWIATVSEPNQQVLTAQYINSNAQSPTSTKSRGFTIVKVDQNSTAPTQSALNQYVANLAYQDSQIYDQVVLQTALAPFGEDRDVYTIQYQAGPMNLSAKFEEIRWTLPLTAGGMHSHTVQRSVSV